MDQRQNTKHQKRLLMTKKVPHDDKYKIANRLDVVLKYIFITSTTISCYIIFENSFLGSGTELLTNTLAFFSPLYFFLDLIKTNLFHIAEFERKNDFIDNSLDTKLSDENSEGYFTNEEIDKGIIKLGVNCFENSYFTKSISKIMLRKQSIYLVIIAVVTLLLITFSENQLIVDFLLLALPYSIGLNTYKIYRLNKNTKSVTDVFKKIFSSTKENKMEFLIIDNVINYEKALSEGGILLNTKIFKQKNKELSQKWDEIKGKYQI